VEETFMLDSTMTTVENQAAGLASLAVESAPRLVALAGHEDATSELPLLMQLCAAWTSLNYPLVVLDAHVQETDDAPGLLQLLHGDEASAAELLTGHVNAWPIIPAALGLEFLMGGEPVKALDKAKAFGKSTLSKVMAAGKAAVSAQAASDRKTSHQSEQASADRAQQVAALFPGYDLILVYAPAAMLARAWQGSSLSPLLPVSVQESALLSAYQALKQMLSAGKLRPTIVTVMQDAALTTRMSGHNISRNLQECARDFLACETPALTVCPERPEEMQRLALRSLEAALQPARWTMAPTLKASAAAPVTAPAIQPQAPATLTPAAFTAASMNRMAASRAGRAAAVSH
jgi:hypothetical protein